MPDKSDEALLRVVSGLVSAEGVDLVECKIFFTQGSRAIRCLVDYPEGGITLDVCSALNRRIVEFLEANPDLGDNFIVEVNSPGLDRPLKTYKDFLRMKGKTVSVWLSENLMEKIFFEGELIEVNENQISLRNKGVQSQIDIRKIHVGKGKYL